MLLTESPYLTIEEAAALLRMTPNGIRRLLREGRLPGRKIGREWRISREALDEFIRAEERQRKPRTTDEMNIIRLDVAPEGQ